MKIEKPLKTYNLKEGKDKISFFFDKGKWLSKRFGDLIHEITKRGLAEYLNTD